MNDEAWLIVEQRIGARVLIFRTRGKLRAIDLASRAGVHVNTILRMEAGKNCSIRNLYLVASALGVNISDLIC